MIRSAPLVSIAFLLSLLPFTVSVAQQAPIRGFAADGLTQRADLETRLRAVPDTARLREYQRIMSENPHHAGSPGSKVVADWALAKFKEFGLDAQIERFD